MNKKRAMIFLFFDAAGIVDDYVTHLLSKLHPHAEHLLVVSNSPFAEGQKEKLAAVCDEVMVRKNVGFDVMAYKDGIDHIGWDNLANYDELILLNYTFFGPLQSITEMFNKMDEKEVDFWGLTDHGEVSPSPFSNHQVLPRHIQSHWIAVRKRMLLSPEFKRYWEKMPAIRSYEDSVMHHETRFTIHFESRGFTSYVLWPSDRYSSPSAVLDDATTMVADGCVLVKRRTFFHTPLYMDRNGILGQNLISAIEKYTDYPVDLIWSNLSRSSVPRDLVANLNLVHVLPDQKLPEVSPEVNNLRVVALAHIFYPSMTAEIVNQLQNLPSGWDLIITTPTAEKAKEIESKLETLGIVGEVRVVASNRGRDVSAFLLGCADVFTSNKYDLVVKIHSKLSPQDGPNVGGLFKRHLYECLLGSSGHAANVLNLFIRHPNLGMVIPPVPHIGYPTMGHAWFENKKPAQELMATMGLHLPFDDTTPVAAYGSMFIARPELFAPLVKLGLRWEDFPDEGGYIDGSIAHVIERLFAYVVLAQGHHVREVINPEQGSINYGALEYKLQALSKYLSARTDEAERDLKMLRWIVSRDTFKREYPRITAVVRPILKQMRLARIRTKRTASDLSKRVERIRKRNRNK